MAKVKPGYDKELKQLIRNSAYDTISVYPSKRTPTTGNRGPGRGWVIRENGYSSAGSSYDTKREAKKDARKIAKRNKPAVLLTHGKHGQLLEWHKYN